MSTMITKASCTLLLLAVVASPVHSQAVKKYVTPDNRVIYSDQPVPGAREVGEVEPPTPVSPEARDAAKATAARDAQDATKLDARTQASGKQAARIKDLEANLALARKKLADGQEPLPGERTGTAGGASQLNERYWARQAKLKNAVAEAQELLDNARSGK
jgi:hypothetical protein